LLEEGEKGWNGGNHKSQNSAPRRYQMDGGVNTRNQPIEEARV